MRRTITGKYKSSTKYEAAAEVLVDLCWGKTDELEFKLQTIFGCQKAKWLLDEEQPIKGALDELYNELDFCEDILTDLAEIDPVLSPMETEEWHDRVIWITGLLACGEIGRAIRYCCEQLGLPEPQECYDD